MNYPIHSETEARAVAEGLVQLGAAAETELLRMLETADGWKRTAISLALRQGESLREGELGPITGLFEDGAPLADTGKAIADITARLDELGQPPKEEFQAWGSRKASRPRVR
jgi:hypothetical protein